MLFIGVFTGLLVLEPIFSFGGFMDSDDGKPNVITGLVDVCKVHHVNKVERKITWGMILVALLPVGFTLLAIFLNLLI